MTKSYHMTIKLVILSRLNTGDVLRLYGTCVKSETNLHCKLLPVSASDTLKDIMRISLLITRFIHEN